MSTDHPNKQPPSPEFRLLEIVVRDPETERFCTTSLQVPKRITPAELARFLQAFLNKFIGQGRPLFEKSVKGEP